MTLHSAWIMLLLRSCACEKSLVMIYDFVMFYDQIQKCKFAESLDLKKKNIIFEAWGLITRNCGQKLFRKFRCVCKHFQDDFQVLLWHLQNRFYTAQASGQRAAMVQVYGSYHMITPGALTIWQLVGILLFIVLVSTGHYYLRPTALMVHNIRTCTSKPTILKVVLKKRLFSDFIVY